MDDQKAARLLSGVDIVVDVRFGFLGEMTIAIMRLQAVT